tara:strand:+ start:309 stop:956 length:648 start_codon:yes stop_codon:yes gene_type:complete
MALTKFNFNSFDLTTVASTGLAFNSNANGFDTAAAGAMNLITTNTISSGVSSSTFTSGIDSTYDTYMFKLTNIHCASNAVDFRFNGSIDGGSNYNVTKTTTFFNATHQEDGGGGALSYQTGNDLAQSTAAAQFAVALGNDADQSLSAIVYLFSPASTTFVKHFIITSNSCHSSDKTQNHFIGGYFNTTSAIDAIQFTPESGNIDSGVIKMYGITK